MSYWWSSSLTCPRKEFMTLVRVQRPSEFLETWMSSKRRLKEEESCSHLETWLIQRGKFL